MELTLEEIIDNTKSVDHLAGTNILTAVDVPDASQKMGIMSIYAYGILMAMQHCEQRFKA